MLRRSKRLALQQHEEIIPNLPDDVARNCLLRMPYKLHSTLKLVCRKWRETVSEPKFYKDRLSAGTSDPLICMIKYLRNTVPHNRGIVVLDPITRTWENLPQNPEFPTGIPLFCACVCVNGKLVFIGGHHPESSRSMKEVYIFDFASAKWRRGADMPTKRQSFACSVSSTAGLIYVAGGRARGRYDESRLLAAEAYNVEEDKWNILPPMTQQLGACYGVFLAQKFFVFGESGKNAEFFDPKAGMWRRVDNMWRFQRSYTLSFIVASGHLYTASTKRQLMKYNVDENDWVVQSVLPERIRGIGCTTEWRGHIFVNTDSRRHFCYLLNPSTNELIEIGVPEIFHGITVSAATIKI